MRVVNVPRCRKKGICDIGVVENGIYDIGLVMMLVEPRYGVSRRIQDRFGLQDSLNDSSKP